jgi:hypothetical protein
LRITLKFAELQTPLFLEGVNHGVKLNQIKHPLKLLWDFELDKLIVGFKNAVALIPAANVASVTPVDASQFLEQDSKVEVRSVISPDPVIKTMVKRGRPSAQVSSPTSHVFEGENK